MNLFRKRKNVLAVILTTTDVKRLQRCYKTLKDAPKNCSIDIEIMINTLNEDYPKIVYEHFKKEPIKIFQSESNGTSGKGGNKVLEHFRNHKNQYDYLMMIDGDDFFYPTAFECFEKLLVNTPDAIGLQASDTLIRRSEKPNPDFYHFIKDDIYMNSWGDREPNLNVEFPKLLTKPVYQQHPPDRVLFFSERLLKTEKDLMYNEQLRNYSDYAFSVSLFERALNNGYSYAHFSNSCAYVYDRLGDHCVTKTAKELGQGHKDLEKIFKKTIQNDLEKCGGTIDFRIIPFFKLGPPPSSLSDKDKVEFIKSYLIT